MSLIEHFWNDMRPLIHMKYTTNKDQIGEKQANYNEQWTIQAVLVHKREVSDNTQQIKNQIEYQRSGYLIYYDHTKYTLSNKDRLVDELGTTYKITEIEPGFAFGWTIEYYVAYITNIQ
jgi:hypothetical protein